MSILKDKKQQIISDFSSHPKETGSIQVQCAILSERIKNLTLYTKQYKKDIPPKRSLLKLVAKRKRLLNYLKKKNQENYNKLVEKLNLKNR